jgi:hypothetical protein
MSATCVRAQAFGQPLTLTEIGVSRSGNRRSSSSMRSDARCLVSTIASLQNSMPVQAMVERRQCEGRAESPMVSRAATSGSTLCASTPMITSFWYAVNRAPSAPYLFTRSPRPDSTVPETRPTVGATPM